MKTIMPNILPSKERTFSISWIVVAAVAITLVSSHILSTDLQATTREVPLQNWTVTSSLPQALAAVNAIAHDDTIYLVGGRKSDENPTTKVYKTTVNADGTLSSWTTASPLPKALYLHSVSANDTHMYAIGGFNRESGGTIQTKVYRAAFRSNGTLGEWQDTNQDYPTKVDIHDSVVVNDRLYSFGGFNGQVTLGNVYYTTILDNGSLSTWQVGLSLPTPLRRHAVTAHNDYVYVVGGFDSDTVNGNGQEVGGNGENVVYYAKVNADGTLGTWQTGPSLPNNTYYHRLVVHDGRLVLLAGKNNGGEFNQVYSSDISANGSLDVWQPESALPKTLFRFGAVSVEKYGSEYIFVIGGFSNNQPQTSVYHSAVPATPTPTSTPTLTPTPTPPVSVYATLSNSPTHWIAPGEEITYKIEYGNDGTTTVENAAVSSAIPFNTELVTGTISTPPIASVMASASGSIISWNVGTLAAGGTGIVEYTVRRLPLPPSTASLLDLKIDGPSTAAASTPITYTLTLQFPGSTTIEDVIVDIPLPEGSLYIDSNQNGTFDGSKIEWVIGDLAERTTRVLEFVVSAPQSIIIKDYYAVGRVPNSGAMTNSIENEILVTDINSTPPAGIGDNIIISNNTATLSWLYNGQSGNVQINSVKNPVAQNTNPNPVIDYRNFLPLVNR